jgi:hypothetical protein
LGFDWLYKNHKYSHKEQQLLQLFAEILVNLISRKEVNKIIKQQAEVERLTAEISSDFVRSNSQNIQEVITKTSRNLPLYAGGQCFCVLNSLRGRIFK